LNKFWNVWINQYLLSLRERNKSKDQQNFAEIPPQVGRVVIVYDEETSRSMWKLAKIIQLIPSSDGPVRSAKIKCQNNITTRAIEHLFPLELNEDISEIPQILQAKNMELADRTIDTDIVKTLRNRKIFIKRVPDLNTNSMAAVSTDSEITIWDDDSTLQSVPEHELHPKPQSRGNRKLMNNDFFKRSSNRNNYKSNNRFIPKNRKPFDQKIQPLSKIFFASKPVLTQPTSISTKRTRPSRWDVANNTKPSILLSDEFVQNLKFFDLSQYSKIDEAPFEEPSDKIRVYGHFMNIDSYSSPSSESRKFQAKRNQLHFLGVMDEKH